MPVTASVSVTGTRWRYVIPGYAVKGVVHVEEREKLAPFSDSNKLIPCSAGDLNYDSAVSRLSDEELLYNLLYEGRKTAWRKLKKEAEKRGFQRPFEVHMKSGQTIIMAKSKQNAKKLAQELGYDALAIIDKWAPRW